MTFLELTGRAWIAQNLDAIHTSTRKTQLSAQLNTWRKKLAVQWVCKEAFMGQRNCQYKIKVNSLSLSFIILSQM